MELHTIISFTVKLNVRITKIPQMLLTNTLWKDLIWSLSNETKLKYQAHAWNWSEHKLLPLAVEQYVSPITHTGSD